MNLASEQCAGSAECGGPACVLRADGLRSVRAICGALFAVALAACGGGGGGGGGPTTSTAYFEGSVSGLTTSNAAGLEGGGIVLKGNDGQTYPLANTSSSLQLSVSGAGGVATLAVERHPVNQICTLNTSTTALGSRGAAALSCVFTPVNDTGLSQCMPGVDCALQDAGAGRSALAARLGKVNPNSPGGFDYTRICNNGKAEGSSGCSLAAGAQPGPAQTDWGCTRDNVTGLVWLATDFDGRYQQQDVNALMTTFSACGKGGWRIPSVDQLHSLISSAGEKVNNTDTVAANLTWLPMLNFSRRNSRPDEVPQSAERPEASGYWTSSLAGSPVGVEAWSVLFEGGGRVQPVASTFKLRIAPVSTADLADRFADSYHRSARWSADLAAGTLLDRRSGLMWQICSIGKTFNAGAGQCQGQGTDRSFRDALTDSSAVNQDATRNRGYTDWRLPNRAELASLVDCLRWRPSEAGSVNEARPAGCTEPDLQRLVALDAPASSYWSSSWLPPTPAQGGTGEAFTVEFSNGMVGLEPDLNIQLRVRLVRSAR